MAKSDVSSITNVEAFRRLFGEHPEDVISTIKSASDAMSWLEQLFKTIEREALDEHNGYRIKHLAEMGAYIACDMGNYADSEHEKLLYTLKASGAVRSEVDHV